MTACYLLNSRHPRSDSPTKCQPREILSPINPSRGQTGSKRKFRVADHKRASNWGERKFTEVSLPFASTALDSFLLASLKAGE